MILAACVLKLKALDKKLEGNFLFSINKVLFAY